MAQVAVTASVDLSATVRYLNAWSFAENAGTAAAATVLLRNGSSAGAIYAHIELAADGSKEQSYDKPLYFPLGLYVHVSAGTIRGGLDGS